jgi:DNA polymerase III sliding clamp (beta) subunit (PCNA family)
VLLDFDVHEIDGVGVPICTAVATDGDRIHILHLPRMVLESSASRLPPAIRVPAGFFSYMMEIVKGEWAGMEFGPKTLVARGKDFMAVAKVAIEPRKNPSELGSWRKVNVEHKGSWMIDSSLLEEAVSGVPGRTLKLIIDSMDNEAKISSMAIDGTRYRTKVSARRYDGAPYIEVRLSKNYFMDAIRSCSTKLVRLSFEHSKKHQPSSPVVIRGEDEQFKAIVMPITEGGFDD